MIYIGSDHGGFELKEQMKEWLGQWQCQFEDCGAFKLDPEDDYPQFAFAVAQKVSKKDSLLEDCLWEKASKGILICRSAGGVIIAANKVKGVRAVAVYDEKMASHARLHNNANIIGISGDWTNPEEAKKIVKTFLDTQFSNEERHARRLEQIKQYKNNDQ